MSVTVSFFLGSGYYGVGFADVCHEQREPYMQWALNCMALAQRSTMPVP